MSFRTPLLILVATFLFRCAEKKTVTQMNDDQLRSYANELAHKYIIADGHVDLPERLKEKNLIPVSEHLDIIESASEGEFDYVRARKGGLDAPFMSIFIPSSYQKKADSGKSLADSLIDMVVAIGDQLPDKFSPAMTPAEVEANFKLGKISLPMGMENGAPIGNDLANVKYFYDRGIRYITLTHNDDNQICDASRNTVHTWNGLSPFGKEVVAEMNRLGIMVDISHVDDSTFYQVMKLSKSPCIASHSSCRYFAPTIKRDMTDDMIRKLGENGGVMLINFYSAFLDSAVASQSQRNDEKLAYLLAEKGLHESDPLAKPIIDQFDKENPLGKTDIEMVANHIDHVVEIAGIDHVGFGSDFDGVDGQLPTGLEDPSKYPDLIFILLKRGYTEDDIAKICYKNLWRVWNKVEQLAKEG
ncbi:MAG: dipeptidase [Cyclobacteriaceae bacterium]|jgi:membrane dipeptidase|nr:dipeptidase [Cyclobacteriaceae bacterium]MDH5247872.1 dipeptidase [Cyclobacteriaceae bacterium]